MAVKRAAEPMRTEISNRVIVLTQRYTLRSFRGEFGLNTRSYSGSG